MKIKSLEPMQAIEATESSHLDDLIEDIHASKHRAIDTENAEEPPISSEDEHTKNGLRRLSDYLEKQKKHRKKHKKNSPHNKYQALDLLEEELLTVGQQVNKVA